MPGTDFSQMSNMLYMVDHYQLHVKEARDAGVEFNLADFIYLHYISPDGHSHDSPVDHDKLPLKHVSCTACICEHNAMQLNTQDYASADFEFTFSYINPVDRIHSSILIQPPITQ